jgi:hypothetical protein
VATFGRTTFELQAVSYPADTKIGSRFALVEAGDVTKLTAHFRLAHATAKVRGLIYAASGTEPAALVAVTNEKIGIPSNNIWVDLPLAAPVSLSAGNYFLCLHGNTALEGLGSNSGVGVNRFNTDTYADGATNPFGAATSSSYERAIYATYTATVAVTRRRPLVAFCG